MMDFRETYLSVDGSTGDLGPAFSGRRLDEIETLSRKDLLVLPLGLEIVFELLPLDEKLPVVEDFRVYMVKDREEGPTLVLGNQKDVEGEMYIPLIRVSIGGSRVKEEEMMTALQKGPRSKKGEEEVRKEEVEMQSYLYIKLDLEHILGIGSSGYDRKACVSGIEAKAFHKNPKNNIYYQATKKYYISYYHITTGKESTFCQ